MYSSPIIDSLYLLVRDLDIPLRVVAKVSSLSLRDSSIIEVIGESNSDSTTDSLRLREAYCTLDLGRSLFCILYPVAIVFTSLRDS